jgi:tRNA pseudouridine13 synthase
VASPLPFLTADLPGVGGELKQQASDFEVEEIPAYLPNGAGEHLFLWIEKTGIGAEQLSRHIVQTLRLSKHDLGVAALKDRHAITRQFVSVPSKYEEQITALDTDQIRVLSAVRHGNKLKTGHVRGNRFSILIRNVAPGSAETARQIATCLKELGAPNYFGDQRFGVDGETSRLGFDLLRGEQTADDIHPARRRFLLRFALSSAQSVLFNQALSERLLDGLLRKVLFGDVMQVAASGGVFLSEDPAADQLRFETQEIGITGPMYGPKMKLPGGDVAQREAKILRENNVQVEDFQRYQQLTNGTRRPFLVFPQDLSITEEPEGLRFRFSLPSGCYATVVLREFQKLEPVISATEPTPTDDESEAEE